MTANRQQDVFPIAIDGPAASGKSTVARLTAARLGAYHVGTGDLYRAVSWSVLARGVDPRRDPDGVVRCLAGLDLRYRPATATELGLFLNGVPVDAAALHSPEVTEVVSFVARIPAVREWLQQRQRDCVAMGPVVMEGRDIGTVILPDAPHKFFITASPAVRARRRLAQGGEVAADATVAEVAAQIAERDRLDSARGVAPLRAAPDAVVIDTDAMTAAEVVDRVVRLATGGT